MGMVGKAAAVLLFLLSIVLFTGVSSDGVPYPPPPSRSHHGSGGVKCLRDVLKFGVCGSWLSLAREVVGAKPSPKCCTLLKGLADLEVALCLCTAIKADVLGVIKVKVPVAISLLLNGCGKKILDGFVCK